MANHDDVTAMTSEGDIADGLMRHGEPRPSRIMTPIIKKSICYPQCMSSLSR